MNRIAHILLSLLVGNERNASVHTARSLLERATQARGQSAYEAAQLRANALAMLSVMR